MRALDVAENPTSRKFTAEAETWFTPSGDLTFDGRLHFDSLVGRAHDAHVRRLADVRRSRRTAVLRGTGTTALASVGGLLGIHWGWVTFVVTLMVLWLIFKLRRAGRDHQLADAVLDGTLRQVDKDIVWARAWTQIPEGKRRQLRIAKVSGLTAAGIVALPVAAAGVGLKILGIEARLGL